MSKIISTLLTAVFIPLIVWGCKCRQSHLRTTLKRFKYLFAQHDFTLAQIPSLLPDHLALSLSAFESDKALVANLTPAHLEWAAQTFGVELEWLEGAIDEIYEPSLYGYKNLDGLFDKMESMGILNASTTMYIFTSDSLGENSIATLWVALEVPFDSTNENDAHVKYIPLSDKWVWHHENAKNHLIHIAHSFYRKGGHSAPVYRVSPLMMERMHRREIIPNISKMKRCKYYASGLNS